jgi:hypothetical protein
MDPDIRSHQNHPYHKSYHRISGNRALTRISEVDSLADRSPLDDISNFAISTAQKEQFPKAEPSKGRRHQRSLSQGLMSSPVGKTLSKVVKASHHGMANMLPQSLEGHHKTLANEGVDAAEIEPANRLDV